MKKLFPKYKHALLALYICFYLPCFFILENTIVEFTPLNSPIDDALPFIDIFIVPYLLWFAYIAVSCLYFIIVSQREFVKMMTYLMIGMTAYLIICYIFPNGLHDFRPSELNMDSVFTRLAANLYSVDTSTNVFPSIHVYNSIVVHIAIAKTEKIKHKWIKTASLILCVSICLSTMFLKQHAIIDVVGGGVMAAIVYRIIYQSKFTSFVDNKTWG